MTLSNLLSTRSESQVELAAKVGVFQTTISSWKRGTSLPPSTRLPTLAAVLGLPLEDLRALIAQERANRGNRQLEPQS